jgi:hypothetical protein
VDSSVCTQPTPFFRGPVVSIADSMIGLGEAYSFATRSFPSCVEPNRTEACAKRSENGAIPSVFRLAEGILPIKRQTGPKSGNSFPPRRGSLAIIAPNRTFDYLWPPRLAVA